MKIANYIVVILASVLITLGLLNLKEEKIKTAEKPASAYENIIKSGTIRAAYLSYPPGTIVNPNTGEVSGIVPDILRKAAENMGLKLEYVEETGWASMIEGLNTGRYDIIGTHVWANPNRGKLTTMSKPLFYNAVGIWVRADETRFADRATINDPSVRIVAMDGTTPLTLAKQMFPKAQIITYPDNAGEPQLFMDIVTNKADVFFAEPSKGLDFLKTNPGKIKNIAETEPLKVYPAVILMKQGEYGLKQMLDASIEDLYHSGFVEETIKKYEPHKNVFFLPAKNYIVEQ